MLEASPKRITTQPDWKRVLDSGYRLFQEMFYPVDGLAEEITDPKNPDGFRLLVVNYGNGKYSALDKVTEIVRGPLTLDDIIRYTFDLKKFRRLLGKVLGFEPALDEIPSVSLKPIRFGTYQVKPGVEFPVYLILAPGCRFMEERLRVLLTTEKSPFILLTATRQTWTQEVLQLVDERKSQIVSLEECLLVDSGNFVKSTTWSNAVNAFCSAHSPGELVAAPPAYEFRKLGQGWLVRFGGEEMVLKIGKGPLYIALLLSKPDEQIFASDLLAIGEGKDPETVFRGGNAGTMSDQETLQALNKKSRTLEEELAQARRDGDSAVEQEILDEMRELAEYTQKVTDGRGKLRNLDDDSDNHRQSVFRAIDRTISEIEKKMPLCAAHFRQTIRTGMMIYYESRKEIPWNL